MTVRYAVYFYPPRQTALGAFGRRWFGRDEDGGPVADRIAVAGVDPARLESLIEVPRGYGFHATLKPPFRLADGRSEEELHAAIAGFAAARVRAAAPPALASSLGRFISLVPVGPAPALRVLADACVGTFDRFRAPPTEAELAKRRAAGLSRRQEQYLLFWGYPYVFEEFRFHMTLTGPIADAAERAALLAAIRPAVAGILGAPLVVDGLALCRQVGPGAPFTVAARAPLSG